MCVSTSIQARSKQITVPGFNADAAAAKIANPVPQPPALKVLAYNSADKVCHFPQAVAIKWASSSHANEFEDLMQSCAVELGYDSMTVSETSGKRKLASEIGQEPPNKKAKKNIATCKIEDIPGTNLASVKMVGQIPEVFLSVHMGGNKLALCNQSEKEQTIAKGSVLFGFGKVTWKKAANADDQPEGCEKTVPLRFHSSSDLVHFGNTVQTVGEVVKDKRVTLATAGICYHQTRDDIEARHFLAFFA